VSAFWVKLGANDLNCVDVPLNPIHSLSGEEAGGVLQKLGVLKNLPSPPSEGCRKLGSYDCRSRSSKH